MQGFAEVSPRLKARIAGGFYLLTILGGGGVLMAGGKLGYAAEIVAAVCYLAVTGLFYVLFKAVNERLSLLAALFSVAGFVFGVLGWLHHAPFHISPLEFFGCYCLLIGYLIVRSAFLPWFLGALMMFGGLGWLTFLSPQMADLLYPWNFAAGVVGESVLGMWLLAVGVNAGRWLEQARAEDGWR